MTQPQYPLQGPPQSRSPSQGDLQPGAPLQGPSQQRPRPRNKGGLIAIVLVSCVLVIALVAAGVLVITSRHSDPLSASEATEALRNVAVSGIGPVVKSRVPSAIPTLSRCSSRALNARSFLTACRHRIT